MEDDNNTASMLIAMFPTTPHDTLMDVLAGCGGDVGAAVTALLAMHSEEGDQITGAAAGASAASATVAEVAETGAGAKAAAGGGGGGGAGACTAGRAMVSLPRRDHSVHDIAALYADAETISGLGEEDLAEFLATEHAVEVKMMEERDAAIARRLYATDLSEMRGRGGSGNRDVLEMQALLVENPEIVANLKDALVPMIVERISDLVVPPMEGTTTSGAIEYQVQATSVAEMDLDPEAVSIVVADVIVVTITDMSLVLHPADWSYAKLTRPTFSSSGQVVCSLKDTQVTSTMRLGINPTTGRVQLFTTLPSSVSISKLKIKLLGTWAKFLYSALITLFKKQLRTEIEATVAIAIDDLINNESADLLAGGIP